MGINGNFVLVVSVVFTAGLSVVMILDSLDAIRASQQLAISSGETTFWPLSDAWQ